MSAIAPVTPHLPSTRRLEVHREQMVIEGHALEDVTLVGTLLGQPVGTAPVVLVVGGITASPYPFGDAGTGAEAWWPALAADDLIDPATQTVLAFCWPGNGSTWRAFESQAAPLSALGLADLVAAWLSGIGCAAAAPYLGASFGGLAGGAPSRAGRKARHDQRRSAPRRLGHRDAPPAARARARWAAHRRRRHRHGARAPARHADLSRPRRDRYALRLALARSRRSTGRRVPRPSRPALRGAVPGAHVPDAQRSDRSVSARPR